jgi:hypothetical protein
VARVAIDHVPKLVRPAEVEHPITAAAQMRERAREAAEGVAAAQRAVDEREREDVEQAAQRARAGEPLGATSRALAKARDALMLAQRDTNAIRLAQQQAEDDVAAAIGANAHAWLEELDRAAAQARQRAVDALEQFEAAALEISRAAGAEAWLRSAASDQRFDRPAPTMLTASVAPSSRRVTANGEALQVDALVGWLREALEPPTSTPAPLPVEASTAQR